MRPNGWHGNLDWWAAQYGAERVISYDMNPARTAPACDAFRGAVKAAVEGITPLPLTHDGSPALARHVANARTRATRYGEYIAKETKDSPNRIDLAVAAVIAFDRAGIERTVAAPVPQFFSV